MVAMIHHGSAETGIQRSNAMASVAMGGKAWKGLALIAVCVVTGTFCGRALAQRPDEPASSNVAASALARVERFLLGVAQLSPMPADTEPDRAQAWPRSSVRVFRLPDGTVDKVSPRALAPVVKGAPASGSLKTGPGWHVELFGGELDAVINPTNGAVESFHDNILSNAICRDPAPEPADCIRAEVAVSRALQYLSLTGIDLNELELRQVSLSGAGPSSSASQCRWNIYLSRLWNGVAYDSQLQSVDVILDAGYGRLLWFGAAVHMPPPVESRVDVSAKRAGEVATRLIESRGYTPNADLQIELRIVQPDNYWTSPQFPLGFTEQKPYTRLAWAVRIPARRADVPTQQYIVNVWVDAATAEVIGGDSGAIMGKNPPLVYGGVIGSRLRSAKRLEARPAGRGKERRKSIAVRAIVLEAETSPLRFFGALAGIRSLSPGMKPKKFEASHRLTALLADGQVLAVDYDARQGLIRNATGEIVQVGPGMRAWLSPLAKVVSKGRPSW